MISYSNFKFLIDYVFAVALLIILFPILIFLYLVASYSTKSNGIYAQKRIGYENKVFYIYKFKTMYDEISDLDTVTDSNSKRITSAGKILRKSKLDEFPQLINVLLGQMSFVGPRPDVVGYAEVLPIELQYLLFVRPGITSSASLFFKEEEFILSKVADKKAFNDFVIWPLKAELNLRYAKEFSFLLDCKILLQTIGIIKYKKFNIFDLN